LSVEPGPGIRFQISYPSTWDGSELQFPCTDPTSASLAVISPINSTLNINLKGTAAYLIQFCASYNGKATLVYDGFIHAPLNRRPIDADKIVLNSPSEIEILKNSEEYKAARQIIDSLTVTKAK
jgi:hypothetical protein